MFARAHTARARAYFRTKTLVVNTHTHTLIYAYTCTRTAERGSPPRVATAPSAQHKRTKARTAQHNRSHMQAPAHMQHCSLIALAGTRESHEAQQRTHTNNNTRSGKPKPPDGRQAIDTQTASCKQAAHD